SPIRGGPYSDTELRGERKQWPTTEHVASVVSRATEPGPAHAVRKGAVNNGRRRARRNPTVLGGHSPIPRRIRHPRRAVRCCRRILRPASSPPRFAASSPLSTAVPLTLLRVIWWRQGTCSTTILRRLSSTPVRRGFARAASRLFVKRSASPRTVAAI